MKTILLTIFAVLFASCGEEQFTTIKQDDGITVEFSEKKIITGGFELDPIKPKVDFLFIWDNSGSQRYVSLNTKLSLARTLTNISTDFDYRIILSPLLPTSREGLNELGSFSSIFSPNNTDIPYIEGDSNPYLLWRPLQDTEFVISTMPYTESGPTEPGIERAVSLLETAAGNNIFREKSNIIIVLISNGDDTTSRCKWDGLDQFCNNDNLSLKVSELSNIALNLQSKQIRFMSLIPFTNSCKIGARAGTTYKLFSELVYKGIPTTFDANRPWLDPQFVDSYDFCSPNHFETLFQGLNNSIKQEMPYTYKIWPVHLTNDEQVNLKDIFNITDSNQNYNYDDFKVYKVDGNNPNIKTPILPSPSNGWSWSTFEVLFGTPTHETTADIWDCNPSHESSESECSILDAPLNGFFIKLNGNAKIKWPDYIRIETHKALDYYGYVRLKIKPVVHPNNRPKFFKNGNLIPDSEIQYLEKQENFNLKILPPFNIPYLADEGRADKQSGYIFRLGRNYIYTNGDVITVKYDPDGTGR